MFFLWRNSQINGSLCISHLKHYSTRGGLEACLSLCRECTKQGQVPSGEQECPGFSPDASAPQGEDQEWDRPKSIQEHPAGPWRSMRAVNSVHTPASTATLTITTSVSSLLLLKTRVGKPWLTEGWTLILFLYAVTWWKKREPRSGPQLQVRKKLLKMLCLGSLLKWRPVN